MKVKIFTLGAEQEAILADGTRIQGNKKETQEAFLARVEKVVKEDYMEDSMEVVKADTSSYEKITTEKIQAAHEKAEGVQARILETVLKSRGADFTPKAKAATAKAKPATKEKAESKAKAEKPVKDEATLAAEAEAKAQKDAEKAEAKAKREEAKAAKAEERAKIKEAKAAKAAEKRAEREANKMNPEAAEALKQEWLPNKGKTATFKPYNSNKDVTATIVGVIVDKRVNMVLVRLKDEDKKLYHKTPKELTLVK